MGVAAGGYFFVERFATQLSTYYCIKYLLLTRHIILKLGKELDKNQKPLHPQHSLPGVKLSTPLHSCRGESNKYARAQGRATHYAREYTGESMLLKML